MTLRLITAIAFALTVALFGGTVIAFVAGQWLLGLLGIPLTVLAGMFTCAGMSLIVLVSVDE